MTEENKRENIKNELDRASKAMDAAILLFENGFLNDAVSRLYYFLPYNIRALLITTPRLFLPERTLLSSEKRLNIWQIR